MAVSVWVTREHDPSARVLPSGDGQIEDSEVLYTDNTPLKPLPYDRRVFAEREYYVPLREVLCQSKEASIERLVAFLRKAVGHLRAEFSGASPLSVRDLKPR
jgi:hypothetical protein